VSVKPDPRHLDERDDLLRDSQSLGDLGIDAFGFQDFDDHRDDPGSGFLLDLPSTGRDPGGT